MPAARSSTARSTNGRARFADNERYFVYRFEIGGRRHGRDAAAWTSQGEFLVQVSTTARAGTTVLEETRQDHRRLEPTAGASSTSRSSRILAGTLYMRIADSFPEDGWGGWLARLRLELQTE